MNTHATKKYYIYRKYHVIMTCTVKVLSVPFFFIQGNFTFLDPSRVCVLYKKEKRKSKRATKEVLNVLSLLKVANWWKNKKKERRDK